MSMVHADIIALIVEWKLQQQTTNEYLFRCLELELERQMMGN